MGNQLVQSPKLKAVLAWIMSESFELGYIPSINQTQSKKLCLILSNSDSGKCALLGTMDDEVVSCTVDPHKWSWAESEGFTRDEITENPMLFDKVFKRVPPEALPWILS